MADDIISEFIWLMNDSQTADIYLSLRGRLNTVVMYS
jgi:hypothetical protein